MISNFQNDEYYTSEMLSKVIHHFFEISKNIPKEPKYKYKTEEFQNYKFKMQEYLTSYCCHLFDICNKMNNVTEQFKEAYNNLYSDFKSYNKFLKKFKCISQFNFEHNQDDGSMSPSNPCYTNFNNDNELEDIKSNNYENNDQNINLCDENFLNNFHNKYKVIKRFIKKEKHQVKIKKLSKSQKKKLRKKRKLREETVANNVEPVHYNNDEDPQAMIQNYFKSYTETGNWSWTGWINCVQKIQLTYPQWFEMFNEFSRNMGINWNEMFVSDLQAIDMRNVRIDMDTLDLTNKFFDKSAASEMPKEGTSVIFTDDMQSRNTTETSHSELFCDACNQGFRSTRYFHIHLRGIKHIQNEIKYVSKQKPEIFLEEINRENASIMSDTNKEDKHMKWLLNNEDISKASGTFTCKLCNVTCSSQKDFKSHLNGEKHSSKNTNEEPIALLISDEKKIVKDRVISKPIKKPVARIQILLDQFTSPLIGLDYVNEYQKRESLSDSWYYCELCNCKCDRKSIISHITSYKHRATYLKQYYYDLYELVEHDPSSKAVRIKRLEVYSDQVELFEGRKKMNIMIEKLSINSPEIISGNSKSDQTDSKGDKISFLLNDEENNNDDIKLSVTNEAQINLEDVDREDGEIESSDDEFCCDRKSESISNQEITKSVLKQEIFTELEAGEIENEIIDDDSDEQCEQIEADINETTFIDKSEFNNYEPLYINNRIPFCAKSIIRDNGTLEFMNHRENKKVKLKEVSEDILNHFKQEAKWALDRLKEINITKNTYHKRNFHLPPSKNPVGPVYPGVSELSNKLQHEQNKSSSSSSTENRYMSPVTEFVDTKLSSVNNSLLHDVQNMLVNKVTNDPLNEIIRQEFLFSSPSKDVDQTISSSSNENNRKSILCSPIDLKLLNETLKTVQNFTEFSSNRAEINNSSDSVMFKKTTSNLEIGKKLSKHNEFLGMDQPPPPIFPKTNPDIYYKIPQYNPMTNIMPPFLTPGMIEHQTIYPAFDRNFVYSYPSIFYSNNNSNHAPSDIFNSYDRTNL